MEQLRPAAPEHPIGRRKPQMVRRARMRRFRGLEMTLARGRHPTPQHGAKCRARLALIARRAPPGPQTQPRPNQTYHGRKVLPTRNKLIGNRVRPTGRVRPRTPVHLTPKASRAPKLLRVHKVNPGRKANLAEKNQRQKDPRDKARRSEPAATCVAALVFLGVLHSVG